MKQTLFLLALTLGIIAFSSCDVIEPPYKNNGSVDTTTTEVPHKVLLEEFTGATCKNCPAGHRLLADLRRVYGNKLITLGIHAGDFAEPTKKFPLDFRTPIGNLLNSDFKINAYPNGLVNRGKNGSSWAVGTGGWGEAIAAEIAKKASIKLSLSPTFNTSSKELSVETTVEALQEIEAGKNVYLALYVVEDSITAPQIDDKDTIPNYAHRDVLRDAIGGAYGQSIGTAPLPLKSPIKKTSTYSFNGKSWNLDHCKIIAFVHTNAPDYTVLQVEEVHIK